jgi:hypothetical protein
MALGFPQEERVSKVRTFPFVHKYPLLSALIVLQGHKIKNQKG